MVLATVIAVLLGIASAESVHVALGLGHGFGTPGPGFWCSIISTLTAGALFLVLLSHAISTWGLGNGACVLVSAQLAVSAIFGFRHAASGGDALGENPLLVLLLVAGWVALLVAWMRARWVVQGPAPGQLSATMPARLHINGIGSLGVGFVFALMAGLVAIRAAFPPDSRVYSSLAWTQDMGIPYFAVLVVLSIAAGVFWTAQVYDHQALPNLLRTTPDDSGRDLQHEAAFDRQVLRATALFIVLSPIAVAILLFAFSRLGVAWLSPLLFLPVVATVYDTAVQWQVHERMARTQPAADQARCECCRQPVEADATHCAACGTCDEHRFHDLVEGWVTVARTETRLSAEAQAATLRHEGIPAEVLATDPAPLYGTVGLYDMRPLIPLAVHPSCGGGEVRVLVPAALWRRVSARSDLDLGEPGAGAEQ